MVLRSACMSRNVEEMKTRRRQAATMVSCPEVTAVGPWCGTADTESYGAVCRPRWICSLSHPTSGRNDERTTESIVEADVRAG